VKGSGLRVEALGVAGAPAPGQLTTSFRLSPRVVVDTGAVAHGLPPRERAAIGHVLLSHSHLDHTMGLPFLLIEATPHVYGLQDTLDAVRESLLDGRIWPDLAARATWYEVQIGDRLDIDGFEIEVGAADHSVPCLNFLFRGAGGAVAIVGDTRCSDDWARTAGCTSRT